jgi:hypothetical protein
MRCTTWSPENTQFKCNTTMTKIRKQLNPKQSHQLWFRRLCLTKMILQLWDRSLVKSWCSFIPAGDCSFRSIETECEKRDRVCTDVTHRRTQSGSHSIQRSVAGAAGAKAPSLHVSRTA